MRDPDDGLRALFVRHLPRPRHLTPVETGMTLRGVPDLHYALDGGAGWVECKATRTWTVPLRPAQVGWMVTHARHGGRVLVAVRRRTSGGKRILPADELWVLRGLYCRELKAGGLRWALTHQGTSPRSSGPLLARLPGGPGEWDWALVRRLLATA